PAEKAPSHFHSAAPFVVSTGAAKPSLAGRSFSKAFGEKMADLAEKDEMIAVITAAMPEGTGLGNFAKRFPKRFFDVGIAEQHAVTFAAGLAKGGLKPVVAIYSTFLQRAYDQIVHDVSLQGLPIVFCLDRAGLTGDDGPTHHGIFDIAYLRQIPRMTIIAPRDTEELSMMCEFAVGHNGPIAIRYPRGERYPTEEIISHDPIRLGRSQVLKEGKEVAILAAGYMANTALDAANILSKNNINPTVINARFLKPLDEELLENLVEDHDLIVTIEEGISEGGFGSAVLEFFERENITKTRVLRMALPDQFIEHGRRDLLLKKYHLSTEGIVDMVKANTKEALKAWRR
ncbi:MAG: 1-deoxy-D-xylulose-5-phosphate synthase, partial [Candidatus Omnitrophica bacterium]|nr:1-deoxy-D-xylulose-5-phosphate synthase [Candidatus Omnitrophota bacterium]